MKDRKREREKERERKLAIRNYDNQQNKEISKHHQQQRRKANV